MLEPQRYLTEELKRTKAVCCDVLSIAAKQCSLLYNSKDLSNLFDFSVVVSTPSVTSDEYNLHNTKGSLG